MPAMACLRPSFISPPRAANPLPTPEVIAPTISLRLCSVKRRSCSARAVSSRTRSCRSGSDAAASASSCNCLNCAFSRILGSLAGGVGASFMVGSSGSRFATFGRFYQFNYRADCRAMNPVLPLFLLAVLIAPPTCAEASDDISMYAVSLVGSPYRLGGTSPETGLDCSGFVGHVFRQAAGVELPRDSRAISRAAQPVARTELQPGDLVFFNTLNRAFSHVGIYLGDDRFVHAASS